MPLHGIYLKICRFRTGKSAIQATPEVAMGLTVPEMTTATATPTANTEVATMPAPTEHQTEPGAVTVSEPVAAIGDSQLEPTSLPPTTAAKPPGKILKPTRHKTAK